MNIWIHELFGATSVRRLTNGGRNRFPVWADDSQRVAFQSDAEGDLGIFWQAADGSAPAQRLTMPVTGTAHVPNSWSPDGNRFLFAETKGAMHALYAFSMRDKTAVPFGDVQSQVPPAASFSADGRWVVYTVLRDRGVPGSDSSVFVQPFPATGAKHLVATGIHPIWSRDGTQIFYRWGGQNFAVNVTTHPTFSFASPMRVNGGTYRQRSPQFERDYDVTSDGKQFVGVIDGRTTDATASATQELQVVLNWFAELKRLVPTD